MAHNIFGSRFVGAREAAWHRLGTVIPEGETISIEEALAVGGIDFRYDSAPIGYTLPSGEFVHSSDRKVILREPTADRPQWDELGVVSDDYRVIQNVDLARGLDGLAKETGWSFETVGALGKGETVFLTLRTGRRSVYGDQHDTYVIVSDGKCANRALQISIARIRVVCQNTLQASDLAALSKITIPHDAAVEGEYAFWLEMIGQLQAAQDEFDAQLERLASLKINDRQAKKIFRDAFVTLSANSTVPQQAEAIRAMPGIDEGARATMLEKLAPAEKRVAWLKALTESRREAAFDCYVRLNAGEEEGAKGGRVVSPETLAHICQTPYAAVQAVAEVVDWGGHTGAAIAAEAALFGTGARVKERALKSALTLVTV